MDLLATAGDAGRIEATRPLSYESGEAFIFRIELTGFSLRMASLASSIGSISS
jgi:hypothetical protein